MGVTRRHFLLADPFCAEGQVLPAAFEQAFWHLIRQRQPLLDPPSAVTESLYAVPIDSGEYSLQLGNPFAAEYAYAGPELVRTYERLKDLDLGVESAGEESAGSVALIDGEGERGQRYCRVHVADALSLSLLQHVLNRLDTGLHIVLLPAGEEPWLVEEDDDAAPDTGAIDEDPDLRALGEEMELGMVLQSIRSIAFMNWYLRLRREYPEAWMTT